MDYHRPYNHMNINDDKSKIVVIHDGCKSFDECPTAEDNRVYQEILEAEDSQAEESDISDDYGAENSDEEEAKQELEELIGSQKN